MHRPVRSTTVLLWEHAAIDRHNLVGHVARLDEPGHGLRHFLGTAEHPHRHFCGVCQLIVREPKESEGRSRVSEEEIVGKRKQIAAGLLTLAELLVVAWKHGCVLDECGRDTIDGDASTTICLRQPVYETVER